ncbi:hypothetical protein ACA910_011397 [Epithemia clementina (nom. ined.)]
MNTDLQAIMARRRRLAESEGKKEGDVELSMSDLHADPASGLHGSNSNDMAAASKAPPPGNDLQSIMERRRRIADGEVLEEEVVEEAPAEPPKSALQEIMERRRRIADGEPDPVLVEQQRLEEEAAAAALAAEKLLQQQQQLNSPEPPKKGSLHDIMERRRRLADGEDPGVVNKDKQSLPKQQQQQQPPTDLHNNSSPRATTTVGGVDKLMLAPPGQSTRPGGAVSSTPVKEGLKSVGVTSEMQKIMERRRKLAETTNFVGDDDDDDDDDDDESEPEELVDSITTPSKEDTFSKSNGQALFEAPPKQQQLQQQSQPPRSAQSLYSTPPAASNYTPSTYRPPSSSKSTNLSSTKTANLSSTTSAENNIHRPGVTSAASTTTPVKTPTAATTTTPVGGYFSPVQKKQPVVAAVAPQPSPSPRQQALPEKREPIPTSSLPPAPIVAPPTPVVAPPSPVVVQPKLVLVHPKPVLVHPKPVLVSPTPVLVQPTPVLVQPKPVLVPEEKPVSSPPPPPPPPPPPVLKEEPRPTPHRPEKLVKEQQSPAEATTAATVSSAREEKTAEASVSVSAATKTPSSTRKTSKPTSPGDLQPNEKTTTNTSAAAAPAPPPAAPSGSPPSRTKSKKTPASGKHKGLQSLDGDSGDLRAKQAGKLSSMLAADEDDEVEVNIELEEEDIDDTTVASDLPESLASAEPQKMPSSLLAVTSADDDDEEDDVNFHSEPVPPVRVEKKAPRRSARGLTTVPVVQPEVADTTEVGSIPHTAASSSRRTSSKQGSGTSPSTANVVEGKPSTRRKSAAAGDDDASAASSRRKPRGSAGASRRKTGSSTAPVAEEDEEEPRDRNQAPVAEIKTTPRRKTAPSGEDRSKGSSATPPQLAEEEKSSARRKARSTTPGPDDSESRRGNRTSVSAVDDEANVRRGGNRGSPSKATTANEDSGSRRAARTVAPEEDSGSRRGPRSLAKMMEDDSGSRRGQRTVKSDEDSGSRRGGRSVVSIDDESILSSSKKPGAAKRRKSKDMDRRPTRKPQGKNKESEGNEPIAVEEHPTASLASTIGATNASARKSKSADISVTSGSSSGDASRGSVPDDFSKLPYWDQRHKYPGEKNGKITVFQRGDKGVAAQWSSETNSWTEMGEVTGGSVVGGSAIVSSGADESPITRKARRRKSGDSAASGMSSARKEVDVQRRRNRSRGGESTRQRGKLLGSTTSTDSSEASPRHRSSRSVDFSDHDDDDEPEDDEDEDDDDEEEEEEPEDEPVRPPERSAPQQSTRKRSGKKKTSTSAENFREPSSSPVSEKMPSMEDSVSGKSFAGFDTAAWNSVSAFGADMNQSASGADAFGGGASKSALSGGFMSDFGDTAFESKTSVEAAPVTFSSEAFRTDSNFDDAFGSPSAFDPASSTNLFAPTTAKPEKVYDNSPLTGMPASTIGNLEMDQRTVLRCRFKGSLSTNPLNGNVLFCCETRDGAVLREVDTSNGNRQVMSAGILSPELCAKVANKYNATVRGLDDVLQLSAGLHQGKGQTRIRVAAMLSLRLLETQQLLHVIAVWQWGSGFPQPVSLLYVMSPPSGSDFAFESSSLRVAHNLLFLAGQSPKGPCVLISKPAMREAWTSNSLPGSGKISSMEVFMSVDVPLPYVAIALTDKTISVWSYKAATESSGNKSKEQQSKRWLFPLGRLNSGQIMNSLDASSLSVDGSATGKDLKNTGHCTHLAWLSPGNAGSSMPLLSASFQNGIAVFHVGLPVQSDGNGVKPLPEPTSASALAQAPKIWPVVAKRWQGKHDFTMSSWINLGPQVNPCLCILLQSSELPHASLVLGMIHIPQYRRGPVAKERLLPFRIIANGGLRSQSQPLLLPSTMFGVVVCHSDDMLYHMVADVLANSSGTCISSLWHPISSQPPGLSSIGDPLLEDTKTDKDGIVHIHTTWQCERHKSESDGTLYDWSRPARRHWICRTVFGDRKSCSVDETKEEKATSHFGDGETVLGGAFSEVVCEIFDDSLAGVTPIRLIRCPGTSELYAVLFRPSLCSKTGGKDSISLDATVVAFVDRSESGTVVRPLVARDAVFLPSPPGEPPRGLLLKKDGLGLAYFTWDTNERKCKIHKTYRPILGVEDDKNYVECKRVFVSAGASKMSLLAVATRLRDFKTVVVCGELVELTSVGSDDWSSLLPNLVTGRSAWLESFEDVLSLVGLEGDDSGYRNFSLVTTQRVLIISSAMEISGECRTRRASSTSLSPLGAFAVSFVSDGKVRYLCCLDGELSHGTIATLSPSLNRVNPYLLLAIRQDRVIVLADQMGIRLIEHGQKADSIFLPTAATKPALLLEPLVANAVSIGGKQNQSTTILRNVVERFGRVVALAHGENEGIGNLGTGLTSRAFEILGKYGLKHAASWLLTGTVKFDRSANTTILPPWHPVTSRLRGALNADAVLHILAGGDREFSDYVKNPDGGMAAALPRPSDPVSYLSRDLAIESLQQGKSIDAMKTLDIVGSECTEAMIVQISMLLEKDRSKDASGILKLISGYGSGGLGHPTGDTKLPSSLAALALSQRSARMRGVELGMSKEEIDRWMKPLAPSIQKGGRLRRTRQKLIGENALLNAGDKNDTSEDPLWTGSCKEAKHIWNEGPVREKDKLLMLDRMEDWLGRRRPVILGKEGASAARDRGALADILNDDNSFGGKSDLEDDNDGWVDGVGEGRTDEANLSGYFRFSEGDSEDTQWRSDGLLDLSPYQIKATVYGRLEGFTLQKSTSSVDEGEPGKVKSLFDLVFEKANNGALVLPSPRGGSLDVGALHTSDRQSRQKCTIEFWYNVPSKLPSGEMILVRRTLGASADDFKKVSVASDKDSIMWELALRSSGELVFRSCGGSTLRSAQTSSPGATSQSEDQSRPDLVQTGKWNHVCVILSSRGLGLTECAVSMLMMGKVVAESKVSMLPPGFDEDDLDSTANLKDLLQKSSMLFGLGNMPGFRLTELRVWACSRSDDDVDSFMREYLNAAEGKKKFKVKIKSKKGATTLGKGNFIAKPGTVGAGGTNAPKGLLSLAPTPKMSLAPQKKEETESPGQQPNNQETGFATDFNAFGVSESASGSPHASPEKGTEEEAPITLWDTALPLSQQVRSSAAAALIRGPPATRHFGGNRGGLPDFSGMERFGVGGIAICGSEKTIVWRDNEDPPALTYPIGASGAIVSDQMDDEGSEFLCCFLARDKRMVVFELQSRTVVVELQMTTKLNFWRFLPPEAGENTLCFMLVTPVGGFHWMPLDESPRPQQVWKRGPDLAGKKVVAYEEGGSNGLDGPDILSRVGLIMVTKSTGSSSLESWIVPIAGDSVAVQVSDDVMGGCLCLPPYVDEGPFLPLLVAVLQIEEGIFVNVMSLLETQRGSVGLGEIAVTLEVDLTGFEDVDFEPPALAMGTFPEAICCSLANIVVVLIRRKGLIVAFELEDGDMSLIAREGVDHFVIDAVMRYSAEVGGAEIVMLLADDENSKDGRMVSFCFRSAA